MCGITAYLSRLPTDVFQTMFNSLRMVQNRGYDSAGICTIENHQFHCQKYASRPQISALDQLWTHKSEFKPSQAGIGHSRWATHGAKTDQNAHPHIDVHQRFALVHNGIIENYQTLKTFLKDKKYEFKSETDSEVIVNLISYHYDLTQDLNSAIPNAIEQLEGTWALAILSLLKPGNLYLSKNGSPLLLGFNDNEIMVASEISGFCNVVKQYVILNNHDLVSMNFEQNGNEDTGLNGVHGVNLSRYELHTLSETQIETHPDPYPYWMIKEIEEQPLSLLRAINYGGRLDSDQTVKLGGLEIMAKHLIKIENLIILACGTSLNAGLYGANWFRELNCFNTVLVVDASEFKISDLPRSKSGVIVLSQSGETKDVHRSMELIKNATDTPIISIVNVVDSLIARSADCGVYLNAGREVAVGSTKSFTSQSVVLVLVAIWFAQQQELKIRKRMKLIQDLNSLSLQSQTILNQTRDQCKHLAQRLVDVPNLFILGRNHLYPIALEGALKLKEIGYIHAEGYCGGALKHGPFALLDIETPVMVLSDHETKIQMSSAIEEITSRKAPVIVLSNHTLINSNVDFHILIPIENELGSLLYTLIFQMTSYYLSLLKKQNPDYPKNLAKVVTVDG